LKATAHPALEAFSGDAGYRWIIERTFAWLGNFRRLSKNYEILTKSAENMVRIAMIQITLAKCV
jgi:putative transposase